MGTWAHDPVITVVVFSVLFALRLFSSQLTGRRGRSGSDDSDDPWPKQDEVKRWSIGKLPDGEVGSVVGTVRAHERTLIAPLTGRPCVYYDVVVERLTTAGLRLCFTEHDGVAFALEDDSGRAIVEQEGADVAAAFDHTAELGEFDDATPEQAALLARHGRTDDRSQRLQFREALLVEGERVTVVGTAQRRPDLRSRVEVDYRAAPPLQLRIVSTDAERVSIASHYVS